MKEPLALQVREGGAVTGVFLGGGVRGSGQGAATVHLTHCIRSPQPLASASCVMHAGLLRRLKLHHPPDSTPRTRLSPSLPAAHPQFMREAGVIAPTSFHVHVRLNGQFYGLFAFVEVLDDTYLQVCMCVYVC